MKVTSGYYLISLVAFGALMMAAHSQLSPTGSATEKPIVGHNKKNEDVIKVATNIVVTKFTRLDAPGPDDTGRLIYDGAEIDIVSVMRGRFAGKVEVRYNVVSMPRAHQEKPPDVGVGYIMFIEDLGGREYMVRRILPATEKNIATVKSLIQVTH